MTNVPVEVWLIKSTDSQGGEEPQFVMVPLAQLSQKDKDTVESWDKMTSGTFSRALHVRYENLMLDLVHKYKIANDVVYGPFIVKKEIWFDTDDFQHTSSRKRRKTTTRAAAADDDE